jgi:hypothetical protein
MGWDGTEHGREKFKNRKEGREVISSECRLITQSSIDNDSEQRFDKLLMTLMSKSLRLLTTSEWRLCQFPRHRHRISHFVPDYEIDN